MSYCIVNRTGIFGLLAVTPVVGKRSSIVFDPSTLEVNDVSSCTELSSLTQAPAGRLLFEAFAAVLDHREYRVIVGKGIQGGVLTRAQSLRCW